MMSASLAAPQLSNRLGSRYNISAIKAAADWLCNEGHAYAGVDENHYKSTHC